MNKTICIIGAGNMGEALIKGLIDKYQVHFCERSKDRVIQIRQSYSNVLMEGFDSIRASSVIVLAVKPQDMEGDWIDTEGAFQWIAMDESRKDKLYISIAAGLPTKYFEKCLKNEVYCPQPRVVRAMPNLPALTNAGISGICKGQYAKEEDVKTAQDVLGALGQTVIIDDEGMMDDVTAVSGSGPAYLYLFIESWINAAKELGFNSDQAKELVYQTINGSMRLLEKTQYEASDLRKKVTSKGGTTEAAIQVLLNGKFDQLIKDALLAAKKRAKELSK